MSNKKLTILAIAAIGSIVLAVLVSHSTNKVQPVSFEQGNLIQGLDPEKIAEIVIEKDGQTITLRRQEDGFVVANKSNYPAWNRTVNDLLAGCLDIRCVELYTEDEANFKDLGVTEENAKDVVKFLSANGEVITGIIVGDARDGGQMAYCRLVDDKKVYVIYNVPWVRADVLDYIDRDILSVDRDNIDRVVVTQPGGEYTLVSEANGLDVALEGVPTGKQRKKSDCIRTMTALTNLMLEDVIPAAEGADLNFDKRFSCLLKDSALYTIDIAQKDSKAFIKCSAEFTDKTPIKKEQAVESQEELQKKEAKLLAREKAMTFDQACAGWIYEVGEYKAQVMTKKFDELVEDITEEVKSE
ncbi:MAG: DUF4340 domain-containing protein [Sedimentisphaerales bacterium]|nr:DUF4340 domain-containing protein [Sedimentisphaerales bacterium]